MKNFNKWDEEVLASMTINITNGIKYGSLKMGDVIPLAYTGGVFGDPKTMAPIYDMLTITPNYKNELREYYERVTNNV